MEQNDRNLSFRAALKQRRIPISVCAEIPRSTRNDKSLGFTLVELAIALMVIGLLIGGVLKGQELIENARITSFIRQVKSYETAVTIFRGTYNALPGDIRNPVSRIPNCNDEQCRMQGDGNGRVLLTNSERKNYWYHMELAGLISGSNWDGSHINSSPTHAWGGHTSIKWMNSLVLPANYYYISDGSDTTLRTLRLQHGINLDLKIDDGKPMTGIVTVIANSSGVTQQDRCYNASDNTYVEEVNSAVLCVVWWEAEGTNN